jgi:hypothetical protein
MAGLPAVTMKNVLLMQGSIGLQSLDRVHISQRRCRGSNAPVHLRREEPRINVKRTGVDDSLRSPPRKRETFGRLRQRCCSRRLETRHRLSRS